MSKRAMTRAPAATLALVLGLFVTLTMAACGDDNGSPGRLDGGGGGAGDSATGGADGTTPDGAQGDLGSFGTGSCQGIFACIAKDCDISKDTYNACVVNCRGLATRAAQKLFDAYVKCSDGAKTGACATSCTGTATDPTKCSGCLQVQCATEYLACEADK